MKINHFLKNITPIVLICFVLSCQNEVEIINFSDNNGTDSTDTTQLNTTVLNALTDIYQISPEQITRFNPTEDFEFTTSSGNLKFTIPANTIPCVGLGNCPTDSLDLIVKEFLTPRAMFFNNVQTQSNQNLLVTGGAFEAYIRDENGNDVSADGVVQAELTVATDVSGFENDLMYFTGERITQNNQEVVDWNIQESNAFFEGGVFNMFGINMGLSNCDALYDIAANNPTQFTTTVTTTQENADLQSVFLWLFIDDFPSVVNITTQNDFVFETYQNSIPNGLNATLLAVGLDQENRLMFKDLSITVAGDDNFEIDLEYGTQAQLTQLVNTITN